MCSNVSTCSSTQGPLHAHDKSSSIRRGHATDDHYPFRWNGPKESSPSDGQGALSTPREQTVDGSPGPVGAAREAGRQPAASRRTGGPPPADTRFGYTPHAT